jgi:hypothetical protein
MIVGRSRSSGILRVAAALGIALVLASCPTTQKSVGGWSGAATPTPKAAPVVRAPRAYYARVEGLKVYSGSSSSSKVVATLSLNEKVMRFKVERGYALVESTKSAVMGWVDNAQLTWRLPTAPAPAGSAPIEALPGEAKPAEAQPEEAHPEEAHPEEAPPEEPVAPAVEEPQEHAVTGTEPAPAATPVPKPPPSSHPTPRGVGPSIFNPY